VKTSIPTAISRLTVLRVLERGVSTPFDHKVIACLARERAEGVLLGIVADSAMELEDALNLIIRRDQVVAFMAWLRVDGESLPLSQMALLAASDGAVRILEVLLGRGVPVATSSSLSLIHAAAADPAARCLPLLISAGADVNAAGPQEGATPLHIAAFHGAEGAVDVLLAAGARTDVLDAAGNTPAMAAQYAAHHCLIEKLGGITERGA
jgi:hypothetical protein